MKPEALRIACHAKQLTPDQTTARGDSRKRLDISLKWFEIGHSVQMLRKHYWVVVDRETAERYWAFRR